MRALFDYDPGSDTGLTLKDKKKKLLKYGMVILITCWNKRHCMHALSCAVHLYAMMDSSRAHIHCLSVSVCLTVCLRLPVHLCVNVCAIGLR